MGNTCELNSTDGKKSFLSNDAKKALNTPNIMTPAVNPPSSSTQTFKEKQEAMVLKREKKLLEDDISQMGTDPKPQDEKMIFESTRGTSKLRKDSMNNTLTLKDFTVEKLLGTGGFGRVLLVKRNDKKGELYAMKILNKGDIIKSKLQDNINLERDILNENRYLIWG
jgi:hypothetical protein